TIKRMLLGPARAVAGAIGWIASRFFRDRRGTLKFVRGLTIKYERLYGPVRYWLLVQITQLFALALNVGFILAFIALALVSDPAFGWRSTLLDSETTHRITQI